MNQDGRASKQIYIDHSIDENLDKYLPSEGYSALKVSYKKYGRKAPHILPSMGTIKSELANNPKEQEKRITVDPIVERVLAANMLHKTSQVSGQAPWEAAKNTSAEFQRTSDVHHKHIADSSILKRAMADVIRLHNEVQKITMDLQQRKDVGVRIERSNDAYVQLFQEVIAEILRLQNEKFNSQTRTVENLMETVKNLQRELAIEKETVKLVTIRHEESYLRNGELTDNAAMVRIENEKLMTKVSKLETEIDVVKVSQSKAENEFKRQIQLLKRQTEDFVEHVKEEEKSRCDKKLKVWNESMNRYMRSFEWIR